MSFILKFAQQKPEEFWVLVIALLVAWLLAAHHSEQYAVFGVTGSYLYWTCRILFETVFLVAALMVVEKYLRSLISEWVGYVLAILCSLVPFTMAITTFDLIVGLPELGFNNDTAGSMSRGKAFGLELFYLLDNHILLSGLLLMPRLLLSLGYPTEDRHEKVGCTSADEVIRMPEPGDLNLPMTFFDSLKPPLEGHICAMEAQEHYIQITTTTESRMVLHRFSDAVRQTPISLGMQVHRSHWVAHSAVQEILIEGQSMKLELSCDRVVPVSRTFRAAVESRYSAL